MGIRSNFMPRRLIDGLCFLIVVICLPLVFVFEIFIVLPACHQRYSAYYIFTFVLAIFLLFNIKGNFIACLMTDSSVHFETLKVPANALEKGWRYCDKCKQTAPPRSWHCDICKACILKRDHHCVFTGCCVGHNNHRYFILFIIYFFIGSLYAFVYNSVYFWVIKAHVFLNWLSLMKILCPFLMLLTGGWGNIFLAFYGLNLAALLYTGILFFYHWPMAIRGAVCFERGEPAVFDRGWKNNLIMVLGERYYLAWLSPLVISKLLHNGIEWRSTRKISAREKSI